MKKSEQNTIRGRYDQSVMIKVFNSGYIIALLLFFAGSIGSLCDGVIASRGLGVAELAAIGIVYPYVKTMECISLLFSSGSQVIIGRKIGQNKFEEVSKVFYTSLVFIALIAVSIAVMVSVFSNPVSRLFGASAAKETLRPTMEYLVSLAVGAPAQLLILYMIPLFHLDEKKKLIDITTVVMTVVNVTFNIIFVFCGMGIKGIGYSTSISQYVALVMLSTHLFEKKGILLQGKFGVRKEYLLETIKEGSPSAFKNVTSIIFNTIVNNIIDMAGTTEAMAAFSVYKMTKFIFLSVSEAVISPVRMIQSMLHEEKDKKKLREIFRYAILLGLGLSVVMSAILGIFARSIYSIMLSGPVLNEAVILMRWAVIVYTLNIFICYYLAYFQAINKKGIVYSISVVLNIVAIVPFYLLAKIFGSQGVWMGLAVQAVITSAYVILCAWVMGRRNTNLVDKLLVLPVEENEKYNTYDFHIRSHKDAEVAAVDFGNICNQAIKEKKKAYYCSLALEEIIFNILDYQKSVNELKPDIDVHIIIIGNNEMIMRIKDCSKERNPFVKYEYSTEDDELENLGIKIVKTLARRRQGTVLCLLFSGRQERYETVLNCS